MQAYADIDYFDILNSIQLNLLKNKSMPAGLGLSSGRSGLFLLYAELQGMLKDEGLLKVIEIHLNAALLEFGTDHSLMTYYRSDLSIGIPGFAYIFNCLRERNLFSKSKSLSFVSNMNEIILDDCSSLINAGKLSYMHGIAGPLNYFLSLNGVDPIQLDYLIGLMRHKISSDSFEKYFNDGINGINYSAPFGITGFLLLMLKLKNTYRNCSFLDAILKRGSIILYNKIAMEVNPVSHLLPIQSWGWCKGLLMGTIYLLKYGLLIGCIEFQSLSITYAKKIAKGIINNRGFPDLSLGNGIAGMIKIYQEFSKLTDDKFIYETVSYLKWTYVNNLKAETWKFNKKNSSLFNGLAGMGLVFCSLNSTDSKWNNLLLL